MSQSYTGAPQVGTATTQVPGNVVVDAVPATGNPQALTGLVAATFVGNVTCQAKIGTSYSTLGVLTATPTSVPTGSFDYVAMTVDGTAAGINGVALTLNAANTGVAGQEVTLLITTAHTTSVTVTFGTNFRSTGTLATGTVAAKAFAVMFVSDGTAWYEVSRSVGAL